LVVAAVEAVVRVAAEVVRQVPVVRVVQVALPVRLAPLERALLRPA
jgi:hypothetical protein